MPNYIFFFNYTATTEIYPLSLHDALPIWHSAGIRGAHARGAQAGLGSGQGLGVRDLPGGAPRLPCRLPAQLPRAGCARRLAKNAGLVQQERRRALSFFAQGGLTASVG